jgi:hypothetical protein
MMRMDNSTTDPPWTFIFDATPAIGQKVKTFCPIKPWCGEMFDIREFRGLTRTGDSIFHMAEHGDVIGVVTHWQELQ